MTSKSNAKLAPVADATNGEATQADTREIGEPEVADLNAAVVTLEYTTKEKGKTVTKTATLPKRRGRWSTEAAEALEDDKFVRALRYLVGELDWEAIKAAHPLVDDLNVFADYAGEKINAECVP
jgi:hypothetical protein